MDQTIDVRIRAQTAELKTGLNQAASSTEQAAQKMRASVATASSNMQNAMSQASARIATAGLTMSTAMKASADAMKMSMASMGGAFSNLFTVLAKTPAQLGLVVAAFAGLAAIKKGVSDTLEFTEASMDLGRALGVSASQASIFKLAAEDLGFTQGELEGASKGLTRQLKSNEGGMNRMGLTTRDANGNFKSLDKLLTDGISLLNTYKEGTDRNVAAQALFGRGLSTSSKLMLYNAEKHKELETMAKDLNLIVGTRSVEAWNKLDQSMDTVGFVFKAIFKMIGDTVIPIFNHLADLMRDVLPTAIIVLKIAFGGLAIAMNIVVAAASHIVYALINAFNTVKIVGIAIGEVISKTMTGDFTGAANAVKEAGVKLGNEWATNLKKIEKANQAAATNIKHIWARDTPIAKAPDGLKSASDKGGEPNAAGGGLVAAWEGELDRMKLTFTEMKNIEGSFQAYSIAEERKFWQAKLALTQQGSADNIAVRKKIAEFAKEVNEKEFQEEIKRLNHQLVEAKHNEAKKLAIIEQEVALTLKAYGEGSKEYEQVENKRIIIAQKAADWRVAIAQKAVEREIAYRYAQLAAEEAFAQLSFELAQTNQAELIQQKAQFEDKRFAIAQAAAQNSLSQIDPDKDPVKYAEQAGVIQQIEIDHQAKMRDLKQQMQLEQSKPELAIFQQMQTGFEEAMLSMITRAQSFADVISNLFRGIYKVFVTEMAVKPLADLVARFAREQILHRAMALFQIGAQAQAASAVTSLKTAEAGTVVAANAAESASGAMASQSAIPFVGPALGMAAAIAAFAFAMSFLGKGGGTSSTTTRTVPSAAGGFDIPEGLNPITKLHEKEMVLPAEHADTIRNLKGSNVAFEALNFHITTMDSKGVKEFLLNNKMALADSLKSALRDFKA